MSLALTTPQENGAVLGDAGARTALQSRRGYAGASCPQASLTRAALPPHHWSPPPGAHAEEPCPWGCCAAARALRASSRVRTAGDPVGQCGLRSELVGLSIRRTSQCAW